MWSHPFHFHATHPCYTVQLPDPLPLPIQQAAQTEWLKRERKGGRGGWTFGQSAGVAMRKKQHRHHLPYSAPLCALLHSITPPFSLPSWFSGGGGSSFGGGVREGEEASFLLLCRRRQRHEKGREPFSRFLPRSLPSRICLFPPFPRLLLRSPHLDDRKCFVMLLALATVAAAAAAAVSRPTAQRPGRYANTPAPFSCTAQLPRV